MQTQIRVIWGGDGKFRYFTGLQSVIDYFCPDEIADMSIAVIFGAVVIGSIDNIQLAVEAKLLQKGGTT
jgi:hypothetical protein